MLFQRPDLTSLQLYSVASFLFCVVTFSYFRVAASLALYFSFHDTMQIVKAAGAAVAAASLLTFSFARLDEMPRSLPAIHFLVIVTGAVGVRFAWRFYAQYMDARQTPSPKHEDEQNIILIGANRLTWFYIRMLDTFGEGNRRIVAILDDNPKMKGRSIHGHMVVGGLSDIGHLVHDYKMHGTEISSFVVCERDRAVSLAILEALEAVDEAQDIDIELLSEQLGFFDVPDKLEENDRVEPDLEFGRGGYFMFKRMIDLTISACGIIVLAPLFCFVAMAVLIDSGYPIVFWQRRIGRGGKSIFVYKFRTMLRPIDRRGQYLSDEERKSPLGAFLRATRFDELPQLFNVLTGSMSLIGPRPLLPVDQPAGPQIRLQLRPGITGWAQIHGGQLINAEEKGRLDDYYVRNASLALDALIVWRTLTTVVRGDKHRHKTLDGALKSLDPPISLETRVDRRL